MWRATFGSILISLLGCGGDGPGGSIDADRPLPDGGPAADAPVLPSPDATPGPDANASACAAEIEALGAEMYALVGSCTAIVRLDHETRALLGWELICAPYNGVDEATARANAEGDTGYGAGSTRLSGAAPTDEWVFYEPPGDFGGASAVSARTGRSVFGGSIVWNGAGDLTYPNEWRAAQTLPTNCPDLGPIPAIGYDLAAGTAGLSTSELDAAIAVVRTTPLPAAMWTGGYVFDAVVLRYPRSVGLFDPSTAEWIVLLNGGWLE